MSGRGGIDWGGAGLWLRRHNVPAALGFCLVGLSVVLGGFWALNAGGRCVGPECRANQAYWGPVVTVASFSLVLAPESVLERVTVRPAAWRRFVLVLVSLGVAVPACGAALLSDPATYGVLAAVRNVVGFLGLLLLGLGWMPQKASWLPFISVVLLTAFYASSNNPGLVETMWGFARQPGGLHTPVGELDLSWPTAVALLLMGAFRYVRGGAVAQRSLPSLLGGRWGRSG